MPLIFRENFHQRSLPARLGKSPYTPGSPPPPNRRDERYRSVSLVTRGSRLAAVIFDQTAGTIRSTPEGNDSSREFPSSNIFNSILSILRAKKHRATFRVFLFTLALRTVLARPFRVFSRSLALNRVMATLYSRSATNIAGTALLPLIFREMFQQRSLPASGNLLPTGSARRRDGRVAGRYRPTRTIRFPRNSRRLLFRGKFTAEDPRREYFFGELLLFRCYRGFYTTLNRVYGAGGNRRLARETIVGGKYSTRDSRYFVTGENG